MDASRFSISATDLYATLGSARAPVIVDVRRAAAFDPDDALVAGAMRRLPEDVDRWRRTLPGGRSVVVYCVHGHVRCATPFDVDGAEPFTHQGQRCSLDAFLRAFGLNDPGLDLLARIVRGADTGRPDLTPQSGGLLALSQGLSDLHPDDDHAMLAEAMIVYDALYAWCRRKTAEGRA